MNYDKNLRFLYISFASLGNGREVILVNPYHTSKKCSNCGHVVKDLKLSDRTFFCPVCGWKSDRDYNASLNILKSGLEQNPYGFCSSQIKDLRWESPLCLFGKSKIKQKLFEFLYSPTKLVIC
jgi:transposase